MAKKKKITIKIVPDYSKGNGHTEYSGYGFHKTIKNKKIKRVKNKQEENDVNKGNIED